MPAVDALDARSRCLLVCLGTDGGCLLICFGTDGLILLIDSMCAFMPYVNRYLLVCFGTDGACLLVIDSMFAFMPCAPCSHRKREGG